MTDRERDLIKSLLTSIKAMSPERRQYFFGYLNGVVDATDTAATASTN